MDIINELSYLAKDIQYLFLLSCYVIRYIYYMCPYNFSQNISFYTVEQFDYAIIEIIIL